MVAAICGCTSMTLAFPCAGGWQLAPQYWGKPTTAAPRPTPRAPPPSISPSAPNLIGDKDVTERFFSLTTVFSGVGSPYGGCGSKAEHLFDDDGKPLPFVALNFVKTRIGAAFSFDNPGSAMGAFQSGANCGRWIKMTPKRNCPNGSHTTTTVCNVGARLCACLGKHPKVAMNVASITSAIWKTVRARPFLFGHCML